MKITVTNNTPVFLGLRFTTVQRPREAGVSIEYIEDPVEAEDDDTLFLVDPGETVVRIER